ncbi:MAG: HAMP domain-containing histidine kinase [Alphaproteobacteria bacterium]|nr:HAMP domain-containing histidine kinase [Alphaproteobacteria bacterium]
MSRVETSSAPAVRTTQKRRWSFGLSPRILALVIVAVMTAEVAIFLPSIARFRLNYLESLIETGALATLALDATPDNMIDERLTSMLLDNARVDGVVLIEPGKPKRALIPPMPRQPRVTFEIADAMVPELIWDALQAMARSGSYDIRFGGRSLRMPNARVYIIVDELPLRLQMYGYSQRILVLSIIIALFTAGLLYLGLRWLIVRPLQGVVREMTAFRQAPEDETAPPQPKPRQDEIGLVDREFDGLQRELRAALRQKTRLAELGTAMSKINHDLRNMLATAQLVSDRLARSEDPKVREVAPMMLGSIDRAVRLCGDTLDYARDRPVPKLAPVDLADVADEVGVALIEQAEHSDPNAVHDWRVEIEHGRKILADRALLFRILFNLGRNAFDAGAKHVVVRANEEKATIVVDVVDDGPGVPEELRSRLFQPFARGGRPGGSGLGLTIVRDLVVAHGGDITLVANGAAGATFRFTIPRRAA